MPLPLAREDRRVLWRRTGGRERGPHEPSPIVQLDGKRFFERRANQPSLRERTPPHYEQASAALGDEFSRLSKLGAREEVGLDVGDDQRIVRIQRFAGGRETGRQRRRAAPAGLNEERVLTVLVLALSDHRIEFEPGIDRQRTRHEPVLVARRAFERQHTALPSRRADEHTEHVVLADRFVLLRRNLRGIDRRIHRIGRYRENLVDGRAVCRGRHRPVVQHAPVREHPHAERSATIPVTDGQHMQVDGRLIQAGIAGGDPEDLTVPDAFGGPDTNGKNGHGGAVGRGRPIGSPGITAIRQHDDARHLPGPIPIAHGGEGTAQVGLACVCAEPIRRGRRQRLADAEHLRLEWWRQLRQELALQEVGRSRDARLPVGVRDAHAAGDIDKNRDDDVPATGGRHQENRPAEEQDDGGERERAQHHQQAPPGRRQRHDRPAIRKKGQAGDGRRREHGQPPRKRSSKMHGTRKSQVSNLKSQQHLPLRLEN